MSSNTPAIPPGYSDWLIQLKADIAQSRQRAALAVNGELIQLYGRIGRDILERQQAQGWGAKVIDRLANDLKAAFPDMRGWSSSNLKYMRYFAQLCPSLQFGQQPADQLTWFHIVTAHAVKDANGRACNRTKHLPERKQMMQAWADYLDQLKVQH
jgi:hypothetical protein